MADTRRTTGQYTGHKTPGDGTGMSKIKESQAKDILGPPHRGADVKREPRPMRKEPV
jgi:hypothetical protein